MIWLSIVSIHAQQVSQFNFLKESNNELFEKDWSSFDNLISGDKGSKRDSTNIQFDFNPSITVLRLNGPLNSETSKGRVIEMPIFEPDGRHSMKIYQPDSTSHYHLRIFKLN